MSQTNRAEPTLGDIVTFASPARKALFVKRLGKGSARVIPFDEGGASKAPIVISMEAIKEVAE